MNRTYEQHESSILGIEANLVCVILYLLLILAGFIPSGVRFLIWLIPLLLCLFEKKSVLVRYHAAQCVMIQIIRAIIETVVWLIAAGSAGGSLLFGFNVLAFVGSMGIYGLVLGILMITFFVFEVKAMLRAFHWITYPIPFIGQITSVFVRE